MKHLILSATAILAALLGLWLLISAVQAGPLIDRSEEKPSPAAKINLNQPPLIARSDQADCKPHLSSA